MGKIYAIANQKGGVGKTTTTVNLGAALAQAGQRVLLVDVDPQANATSALGFDKYSIEKSTYDLLLQATKWTDIVQTYDHFNLQVLPANPSLAGAEVELVSELAREYRLQRVLDAIIDEFDYIFIDCPPSMGMLTINALTAARSGIIIPVQCEYLALEGLSQLIQTIELVQQHLNPKLKLRGLAMTMYDGRTNLSRQVVNEVRSHFSKQIFKSIIPRSIRISEAPSFGQPINLFAPKSTGALAYQMLAKELLIGDREVEPV